MTPSTSAGRLATISPCCGSIRRPATQQVAIGDSETLRVDQTIYAIGNPFRLSYTLSTGIVSALGRRIENVDGTPTEDVIQIDATINQGNSGGGGLLDSAGRVVGVNTAIASRTGDSSSIGFAVPIDTVRRVVPRLIATGEYRPPALGIGTLDRLSEVSSGGSAPTAWWCYG